MDAISPFSLADKLNPSKPLGALRDFAERPGLQSLGDLATAASDFTAALEGLGAGNPVAPPTGAGYDSIGPSAALGFIGFALSRAAELHEAFAGAPPAPPAAPASQAPENLPRPEDIRAAYGVFSPVH